MNRLFLIFTSLAFLLGSTACERQSWQEARELHLDHDDGERHGEGEKEEGK